MNNKFNKGIGAGGTNTTKNGKKFEEKTDNEFVLEKESNILFFKQSGLKKYLKSLYGILHFRNPDEAYIIFNIEEKPILIILEKRIKI